MEENKSLFINALLHECCKSEDPELTEETLNIILENIGALSLKTFDILGLQKTLNKAIDKYEAKHIKKMKATPAQIEQTKKEFTKIFKESLSFGFETIAKIPGFVALATKIAVDAVTVETVAMAIPLVWNIIMLLKDLAVIQGKGMVITARLIAVAFKSSTSVYNTIKDKINKVIDDIIDNKLIKNFFKKSSDKGVMKSVNKYFNKYTKKIKKNINNVRKLLDMVDNEAQKLVFVGGVTESKERTKVFIYALAHFVVDLCEKPFSARDAAALVKGVVFLVRKLLPGSI